MLVLTEPTSSGRSPGGPRRARPPARDLDRVAERRAGAVGLDVADLAPASSPRVGQRRRGSPPPAPGRWARSGRCCAPSWLTRRAADDRQDRGRRRAAASDSRLSTTTPQPSPRTIAVGAASKVLQRPSGDQHAWTLAKATRRFGREDQVHAAGQRQVALAARAGSGTPGAPRPARTSRRCRPRALAPAGRGRTTAGPRRRSSASARGMVGVDSAPAVASSRLRVVADCMMPTKTPVRLPASRSGAMAGVLQRLPGDLEQQPLLRVHALGLARRDAEERRVEVVRRRRGSRPWRLLHLARRSRSGS